MICKIFVTYITCIFQNYAMFKTENIGDDATDWKVVYDYDGNDVTIQVTLQ